MKQIPPKAKGKLQSAAKRKPDSAFKACQCFERIKGKTSAYTISNNRKSARYKYFKRIIKKRGYGIIDI